MTALISSVIVLTQLYFREYPLSSYFQGKQRFLKKSEFVFLRGNNKQSYKIINKTLYPLQIEKEE